MRRYGTNEASWDASGGAALAIDTTNGSYTFTGRVGNLVDPSTLNGDHSSASIGLLKLGNGTLTLSNASNGYSGHTTVSGGILDATTPATLPGFTTAGMVVVHSGGAVGGWIANAGYWDESSLAALRHNASWDASGAALAIDTTNGSYTFTGSAGNLVDPSTANGDDSSASIGLIVLGTNWPTTTTLTLNTANAF